MAATDLHDAFRRLWTDHVVWTRQYIISALAGLPDADAAKARLMTNQDQIAAAFVPYYGPETGRVLAGLLREHIAIAGRIVGAAKIGDTGAVNRANSDWQTNAAQIAALLASLNRRWPFPQASAMLRDHLKLTGDELGARLAGDWPKDAAAFDAVLAQALMMADALSSGIEIQIQQKGG